MIRLLRKAAVFGIALIVFMSCGKPQALPTPTATTPDTDSRPAGVLASLPPRSMMPSTAHGVENMYLHVSFIDPQHGWLAVDRSVLATADAGVHWRILHTFERTAGISSIKLVTPLRGLVLLEPGLLMTTDGGVTWESVDEGIESLDASFADANYGWVEADIGISHGLGRTNDGGKTRSQFADPCPHPGGRVPTGPFDLFAPERGWIVCWGDGSLGVTDATTLWKTDDDGSTWTRGRTVPVAFLGLPSTLSVLDEQHGWLAAAGTGVLATDDGGETWETVMSVSGGTFGHPGFEDVDLLSERTAAVAIVSGRSAVFSTADAGVSWKQIYPPAPARSIANCTGGSIRVENDGSNGAMMSVIEYLIVTNVSSAPCRLAGTPQMVLLEGGTTTALTSEVELEPKPSVDPVDLPPGARAITKLWIPNGCGGKVHPQATLGIRLAGVADAVPVSRSAPPPGPCTNARASMYIESFAPRDPPSNPQ